MSLETHEMRGQQKSQVLLYQWISIKATLKNAFLSPCLHCALEQLHMVGAILYQTVGVESNGISVYTSVNKAWILTCGQLCSVAPLCLTLCNPMDCSPPGFSVHGILQARILEWVAIPFPRGSSQCKNWTQVSLIIGGFFTVWAIRKPAILNQIDFLIMGL